MYEKKTIFIWLLSLAALLLLSLVLLSLISQERKHPPQLIADRLAPCPQKANCLCSEDTRSTFFTEPFSLSTAPHIAWKKAKKTVSDLGGTIVEDNGYFLHATFRTGLFRFVDDVSLRLDAKQQLIHVRSASRVGYYDFAVNQKRIEAIRARFNKETAYDQ